MARFILLFSVLVASPCPAEPPKLFREEWFTCTTLAEAVNHYVALGEKGAVKELESLMLDCHTDCKRRFSRNERIAWVCRIVFQPKEKEPLRGPGFGSLHLPYNSMPSAKWPLYPLVASGSTYFVLSNLSQGCILAGHPESPEQYLHYCMANGKFRTEGVPTLTKIQALKDLKQLRQSEAWRAIKWTDSGQGFHYRLSEDRAWRFIKAQAEMMPEK